VKLRCNFLEKSLENTQLAYPTAQQLLEQGFSPATPLKLTELSLSEEHLHQQIQHMRDGAVVLYKRSESIVWQVRFKLFDCKEWYYFSTKHLDLIFAKRRAAEMYDRARFKEELGIPQSVKRFSTAAEACMKQLDREIEQGIKASTDDD
jgi:hypothetical protein